MNATQAISLLTLPVLLAQDTPKGTWLTATGKTVDTGGVPIGISQTDGKQGELVSVTIIGTASMKLDNIAGTAVAQGDLVVFDNTVMLVKPNQSAQYAGKILGVVLYDAHQSGFAEVLIH